MITKLSKDLLGKHNSEPAGVFDKKQLEIGVKIEHEHTDDPVIAEAIAKDHLAEIPDYYTRLKKMEREAEKSLEKGAADVPNTLFHATGSDSLHRILSAGKIKTLSHVATESPDKELSVELSPIPIRKTMRAADARDYLGRMKDVSNVFFTRGGHLTNYGDYVVAKSLKNVKPSTLLNSIPNEYVTPNQVSVKRKAKIFVPDEELANWHTSYPALRKRILPKSELKSEAYGLTDRAKALYAKLTKTGGYVVHPKKLGRNAIVGGSTGLGIDADGSDVDMFIPYKRKVNYDRAIERITSKYPSLVQRTSTLKNDYKTTLTGDINGREVDVVLGHGPKANNYYTAYLAAKNRLTDKEKAEIIRNKRKLKSSWFFPETRYKAYKNNLAKDLGLKEHYF